jgi:hypothetical protein
MLKIIESNIHLAQPDGVLEKQLLHFIRHVAIFEALREAGMTDVDPIAVGEPWPAGLFPAIESRLNKLQQDYDKELGRRSESA